MPFTALFPDDHEKITINQGSVGDCYLLATLDCVANLGTKGRDKLKSLFTQTKDGVTVRIPRSEISNNLQLKMIEGRYIHSYDEEKKQDVFFISNAILEEIDSEKSIGAKSNSLAVKILEHLSSYYFVRGWTRSEAMTSLTAHSNIVDRHGMGSTMFVSHLINIEASRLDIDKVIKLKSIDPSFPVYVSMNWGEVHEGETHDRHALRVERITKTSSDHQFALVNPWHNTITDAPLSKTFIAGRDPSFSIFSVYSHSIKFITKILLELSEDDAKLVNRTPRLSIFLKKLQAQQLQFAASDSKRVIELYKLMPQIASMYGKLLRSERFKFYDCIYQANGNRELFIAAFLNKIPRIEMIRELVREEFPVEFTQEIVARCIEAQDQELFQLLLTHRIDVLGQLMFSTKNQDLFLQALIGLEVTQTPPNLTRLKSIDVYISAYNALNSTKPLSAKVNKSLFTDVRLTRTDTELLDAQFTVRNTLDALRNQELSFKELTSLKAIEERKNSLLAQIKGLEDIPFTAACGKLGEKDKEKVRLMFQQKTAEITKEATTHAQRIKTAEESIAEFLKLVDFSFTFAKDFTEDSVHRHGRMLITQLKNLSLDKGLQAAQLSLGFAIHPAIDQAIKAKTAEITAAAQTRLNRLNQALLVIESTARKISEFVVVIPELQTATALQAEQVKQVKLVQALMEEPAVLDAYTQLGTREHSLLTGAFNNKQQEIVRAVQRQLNVVAETIQKVQTYQAHIRGISFDFSSAKTEKEVMGAYLNFLREMDKVRNVIESDKSLAVSAQTELAVALSVHQQFGQEANISAHNRVIYGQIQTALNNSGFTHALHQVGQRVEATKTMISMGHTKHAAFLKPSQDLFAAVNQARDELLTKPKEGKTSTVQAKEKIEAFQRKVLVALTSAGKVLAGEWQTRLSDLQVGTAQVKESFTGPTAPLVNPHGFYSSKTKPSPTVAASYHHAPQVDRSTYRLAIVAA